MTTNILSPSVPDVSTGAPGPARRRRPNRRQQAATVAYHLIVGSISLLWLLPIALVITTSIRSFDDIAARGLGTLPHSFTLSGYGQAWSEGGEAHAMLNSMLVTGG